MRKAAHRLSIRIRDVRFASSVTNPIDIPNCANCHSNKTANGDKFTLYKQEREFWKGLGASDWIANLKATSISILEMHDDRTGTDFLKNYNPNGRTLTTVWVAIRSCARNATRTTVIGVLQSKTFQGSEDRQGCCDSALSQAIHTVHQTKAPMPDSQGRTAACQGCHPAHRQEARWTSTQSPWTARTTMPKAIIAMRQALLRWS